MPRRADHKVRSLRPGQYCETWSLLKIQKLARSGGAPLQSQLLGKLRQKNRLNPGVEMGFHHVGQASLQLLTSGEPTMASQITSEFRNVSELDQLKRKS
ncbi:hypothetical protein AAY473_018613 [Plecturocebus cupreus]